MNWKVSGKYSKIKRHHWPKKLLSPQNQWWVPLSSWTSVLPLPCPVEEATIKANSSPTAKILNSISVRWCLEKTTRMDSQLYLPAGSAFSLIAPLLQCGSCSLHVQTKRRLSIFSHLEIILPCSFPLMVLANPTWKFTKLKGRWISGLQYSETYTLVS